MSDPAANSGSTPARGGGRQNGGGSGSSGSGGGSRSRSRSRRRGGSGQGGSNRSTGGSNANRGSSQGENRSGQQRSGGNRQGNRSGSSGNRQRNRPSPGRERSDVVPAPVVVVPAPTLPSTSPDVAANRRRALTVCAGLAAVPALALGIVLTVVTGPVIGVVMLVVVLAAVAVSLWFASTSRALRRLGARDLRRSEEPRLVNVTQGLCATMGLDEPLVMIVDDAVPNACSLGRDQDDAVVVVTTGLVERLDLVALEGVLAHELAHVQRGETAVASVVLAWAGGWCRLLGGERWVHRVVGHGREYRADQSAVATVRYPPGLRDALTQLTPQGGSTPGSRFSGPSWELTRWVWLDPTVGIAPGAAVGDLDDTAVRLAALEQY